MRDAFPHTPTSEDLRIIDEMRRQALVLNDEGPVRLVTAGLAYGLCAVFLPVWLVALCAALDLGAELLSARLHRHPERLLPGQPDYRLYLGLVVLTEGTFALPAALLWHVGEDPYLKAMAVGLICAALMHVATVRSIHLPLGLLGMAAIVGVAAVSNAAYWLPQGSMTEWAFSTFCILLGVGYFVAAMRSNHRLHRETAEGRRRAQDADAAKGRFLAQMSHELRTPLNAILGMGRAERDAAPDMETRSRMGILVRSAEGLGTLLDDVLDMSAVEAGRLPIRPRPAVPAQDIAAAATLWRPAIAAAGQHLTVEIDPALETPALIDAQRLRQCLSNLLSNAARHAGPTEVALRARLIPHVDADPVLRIEVADQGPGLDPALRDRLFQPFERGLGSGAAAGSGLGLSISQGLARQMGGELRLCPASPDQKGLCFVLTLPLPPVDGLSPGGAGPTPAPGLPTGLCVLVVDDIGTNRLVAATYLRRLGARPVEAETGPEALAMVKAGGVDLVLLDMNMPDMDGAATFRALRALPGPAARLPVVAMTADAMDGHREGYLALGIDGYVPKPVSPQALATELAAVLARKTAATPPG